MTTQTSKGLAYRIGHGLGRVFAYEHVLARCLLRQDLSPVTAKILFWIVKLSVIAMLVYWATIVPILIFLFCVLSKLPEPEEDPVPVILVD